MQYHIFDLVSPETVEETRRVFAVKNDLGVCLYDPQGTPLSSCDLNLSTLAHLPASVRQLFRVFYRIDNLDMELSFAQGIPIYRSYDQGRIFRCVFPLMHREELIGIACVLKLIDKIKVPEREGLLTFLQRYENEPQRLHELASPSALDAQQALSAAVEELQKNFRLLFEAGEARLQLYEKEFPGENTRRPQSAAPAAAAPLLRQGLLFCSNDGNILDAQAAAAVLLGFADAEDLCGLRFPDHLPIANDSKDQLRRAVESGLQQPVEFQTIRGSSLRAEFARQKDGEQVIGFECRISELTPQAAFESAQDRRAAELIIDQEQEPLPLAEELLTLQADSEENTDPSEPQPEIPASPSAQLSWTAVADLLERYPQPALAFDANNNVKSCNPAMADLLGIETEALSGRSLLNIVVANSHAMLERWKQFLLQSEKSHVVEPKVFLPIIRKDSTVITVRIRLLRLSTLPACFVLFVEGKSGARPSAESSSAHAAEPKDDTTDLRKAQEFCKRVRRQFAALAEQLDDVVSSSYLNSLTNGETKKRFAVLKRLSEKALNIDRHLAFFTGEFVPKFNLIDLNEILQEIAVGLRQYLPPSVELHTEFDPDLPSIQGDTGLLVQMIGMLCRNAAEAMPNGGILTLRTRRVDGAAELQICDTGRGFDPSTSSRLFLPFCSTKSTAFGKGLGLAASYGIAQVHHGVLGFHLNQPAGTVVTFRVPAALMEKNARVKANILIIDDNVDTGEATVEALRRSGYEAEIKTGAAEALQSLRKNPKINLVILDNQLGNIKGPECAQQIRALFPKMPILFCSGSRDEELMRFVSLYGCGFVAKPFQIRELLVKIEGMLTLRPKP